MTDALSWQKIQMTLHESIGLNISTVGLSNLDRAVHHRMKLLNIQSINAYNTLLHASDAELKELIEEVVVPETWFFRNPESFHLLGEYVKKRWFNFNSAHPLQILSIPCSTGEEPYSVVMSLSDLGFAPDNYRVDAVDISERALLRAREGLYNKHSFRHQEGDFQARYFQEIDGVYVLQPDLRNMVNFQQGNVLNASFGMGQRRYHVIFCRNLLIYFDRATQNRTVNKLCSLLHDDGILFLGHAETGEYIGTDIRRLAFPRAFAYVLNNEEAAEKSTAPVSKTVRIVREEIAPLPVATAADGDVGETAITEPVLMETASAGAFDGDYCLLIPDQGLPALAKIASVANQGDLIQAEFLCEEFIQRHDTYAQGYYLMALICEARGRRDVVESMYRKTVYLDPDHYEALLHLAEHAERSQDVETATRLRARARRVWARKNARRSQAQS